MKYYELVKKMQQDYDLLPIFKATSGENFEVEFCEGLSKIKFGNFKNKAISKIAPNTYIPKEALPLLQQFISYYADAKNTIYNNPQLVEELFNEAFIKANYLEKHDLNAVYKYCFMDYGMITKDQRLNEGFEKVLSRYKKN